MFTIWSWFWIFTAGDHTCTLLFLSCMVVLTVAMPKHGHCCECEPQYKEPDLSFHTFASESELKIYFRIPQRRSMSSCHQAGWAGRCFRYHRKHCFSVWCIEESLLPTPSRDISFGESLSTFSWILTCSWDHGRPSRKGRQLAAGAHYNKMKWSQVEAAAVFDVKSVEGDSKDFSKQDQSLVTEVAMHSSPGMRISRIILNK